MQQLLPVLGDGSIIILVSSLGAHAAVGTLSAYAATKGAIDTLVKYFAAALGPRGIRVNAVAPGVIDTDMSNLVKTDEGKSFVLGMQALKRIGQPDDVGSVVAFLASQDARWITGDTIHVDGGSKLWSLQAKTHFGFLLLDPSLAREGDNGIKTTPEQNKALVLEAFNTLFNKSDYDAASRFRSDKYVQHSAHIRPGREGLFNLIRSSPETLRYEPGLILAEGDYVIVHGRFSGNGRPRNWIAADVLPIADGLLVEHGDVLQDEATEAESQSGLPMFGTKFPG